MRKALLITIAVFAMVTAACTKREREPQPWPSKPVITAQVVQMCMDLATRERFDDWWCGNSKDGFTWVYIQDRPNFSPELPAIGEVLDGGRAQTDAPPGIMASRIPAEGAVFKR